MNSINVIFPYLRKGIWMFDDSSVGLHEEPFVGGADTLIDFLTQSLPRADKGFSLTFSAKYFPGSQFKISWVREENGGNVYNFEEINHEAWLCPALFKYFDSAPKEIFVRISSIPKERR